MNKLRPIQAAKEAGEQAIERGRGALLGWLPPRYVCDDCGARCEPTTEYVERQCTYCPVWVCMECGARYHRDADDNPLRAEMWSERR